MQESMWDIPKPTLPKGAGATYSKEEIATHNTRESCWLLANGRVYDVTNWLDHHPAGWQCLVKHAGAQDCQVDFNFHSAAARAYWAHYEIGRLEGHSDGCAIL